MPYQYEQILMYLYFGIFLGIIHWYVYCQIKILLAGRVINQRVMLPVIVNALQFWRSPRDYLNRIRMNFVDTYISPCKARIFNNPNTDTLTTENIRTEVPETSEEDNSNNFFANMSNSILSTEVRTKVYYFAQKSYEGLTQTASAHCTPAPSTSTVETNEQNRPTTNPPFNLNTLIINCLETLNEQNTKLINRLKTKEKEFDLYSYVGQTSIMKPCKMAANFINDVSKNIEDSPPQYSQHLSRALRNCRNLVETARKNIETQVPSVFRHEREE